MKFLPISAFDKNPKSTRPIWGINTAAESELGVVGEVLIAIPSPSGGKPDRLLIPQTWLPQELTRVVTRKRLLESAEFRSAVDKQLISLISIEDAERLLRQDGAAEEQEKIRERNRQIRQAGQARTLADSKTEVSRADGVVVADDGDEESSGRNKTVIIDQNKNTSVAELAANGVEEHEPGIKMDFKMWADRLHLEKDILAKNSIKSRRKFSAAELRYLQRNLPRTFSQSLTLVNATLSKMTAK
jgi:hypothetical protein